MMLSQYLKTIEKDISAGNATEHTHRPALKSLIESLAAGVTATNEPKRIKCGAPDYIVTRGETPLGYIEAKDVGKSLDREEKGEQIGRYLESLDNLLLTDYLEFRWYVRGEHVQTARLGTYDAAKERVRVEAEGAEEVEKLLTDFLTEVIPTVSSPKDLAERMARVARLIRETISRAFKTEGTGGALHQQMKGFREVLIHDLTEEQFADMYAQTICYGLFAARVNHRGSEPFTRRQAAHELPRTNPFLRKLFQHVAGPDLDDEPHAWAVDGLADLLNRTDIAAILKDFGRSTRREDPVVHFYETFLAAYDPKMREARGVYYTPEPVVSYIVRSVDHILKTDFKLPDGLADASKIKVKDANGKVVGETHKVLLLDPATGTGTFLYGVINHIFESFKQNQGMWSAYVSEHLLQRLFGFELLMAPYAVAHMKLGLQLADTGYKFDTDERMGVYLTNTLEESHKATQRMPFTEWLAQEANEASGIKKASPVMIVLGNPPYSGKSNNPNERDILINKGAKYIHGWEVGRNGKPEVIEKRAKKAVTKKQPTFIGRLMWDYFVIDGQRLKEKNPKWVNNDYVKFIRFAQWRIEETGYGALAFITDNSYLDGLTFRGMRQNLLNTFDEVYILNLHGNSNKKERAPDGTKDENVFDIQQGVAISIFIKKAGAKSKLAHVHYAELWGLRETHEENAQDERVLVGGKYHWLWHNDLATTKWSELKPEAPFYLFVPQDIDLREEYEQEWKLTEILPVSNTGIITARDRFVRGFTVEEVHQRIADFRDLDFEEARTKYELGDVRERTLLDAWKMVREIDDLNVFIRPMLRQPFDLRSLFYHESLIRWPVYAIMRHMLVGENKGLITTRVTKDMWDAFACNSLMGHKALAAYDVNYLFPLYLYPDSEKFSLFDSDEITDAPGGRRPNIAPEFIADFGQRLQMTFIPDGKGDCVETFGPEDVFDYMYAVFHSPTYRSRYAEFLKIDFPRLPLTSDPELFRSLCALGSELVGLHLMEQLAPPVASFPVKGDNIVETVRYTEPGQGAHEGRVWINKEQYFENVPPEVWALHVGGYPVCQKWLKDRKGRKLAFDDLAHYRRIIAALSETIRLMSEIDAAIEDHGGFPFD